MKGLRQRPGQPSCFQRKRGTLATGRTRRKPPRQPFMARVWR